MLKHLSSVKNNTEDDQFTTYIAYAFMPRSMRDEAESFVITRVKPREVKYFNFQVKNSSILSWVRNKNCGEIIEKHITIFKVAKGKAPKTVFAEITTDDRRLFCYEIRNWANTAVKYIKEPDEAVADHVVSMIMCRK